MGDHHFMCAARSKGIRFLLRVCILFVFQGGMAQNAIVTENALPGAPISEWGVPNFRETLINGFATEISVNKGQTVRFKVNSQNASNFTLVIYRIGYYNGNGARKIADLGTIIGASQPAGISDAATGLYDCRNWSESASWAVPVNAVSGLYIAKITRAAGGSNHIAFVVRDDAGNSDILFQMTDATWQAYNGYGGSYFYNGTTGFPNGRAVKVSYNRPIFPYNSGFKIDNRQSDWYMGTEYPMIRWIERNGYNVSYTTCVEVARQANLLLTHKALISAGHDEYWSKEQRDNVEAARNAGVHCAFFTGNEVYWKTRWESDGAGNSYHTLVCYKEGTMADGSLNEGACGNKCDPLASVWTGLWRMGGAYDAGKPENALTGQISWVETNLAIQVPYSYKFHRFWRNTSVALLSPGQVASLAPNSLGYEFDFEQYPGAYAYGRMKLSQTTVTAGTHQLSLYRHNSGALVFGAGTIQWSWGLDANHFGGSGNQVSKDMQQATVNLFADMGMLPQTLQSDLVAATASTDVTAPASTISSPGNNTIFAPGTAINITGNTFDGNNVTVVEISFDGGTTWTVLNGTTSWSYTWVPGTTGSYTIKVRGWDDSGNREVPGTGGSTNQIYVTIGTVTKPPTIVTQPQSQTVCESSSVSFSSLVSDSPLPPVQWQSSSNGGSTWSNINGATSAVYTFLPSLANNGMQYRAIWTNAAGSSTTTAATLTVNALPAAPTGSNILSYCYSATVGNLTANGTGIKWYSTSTGGNPLSTGTYLVDGNHYYATQTLSGCESSSRFDVIVSVNTSTAPIIYLNGTGSSGNVTSYQWTLVSGPNTPIFSSPSSATTSVTGITNGSYTFQLSLNGGESVSQVLVKVNAKDSPLVAMAGFDRVVTLPVSSVKLDGGGSTGVITSYGWTRLSGPNQPTIVSPSTISTTITGLIQGVYSFELAVRDNLNKFSRDTVVITVNSPSAGTGSPQLLATHSASSTSSISTNVLSNVPAAALLVLTVAQADKTSSVFTSTQAIQPTQGVSGNDGVPLELGMKFRSSEEGYVTGVRFYKPVNNDVGTHTGELYSSNGTRLAQVVFTGETSSGWQQASFATPVLIQKNTTYIVAYHCTAGSYHEYVNYFQNSVTEGPITGLADGVDGVNGLYIYSAVPSFPSNTYSKTNYWVDVVFSKKDAGVTSTPSLNWIKRADANGIVGSGNAEIYTARFPAGGNISVTTSWSKGPISTVLYSVGNYDTTLAGAAANAISQTSPQVTLNTTKAGSLIFGVTADRNAVNGSAAVYRDAATSSYYDYISGSYTGYHYRKLTGALGTYTEGLSAPTGMAAGTALFEVGGLLPVPVSADAGYNQAVKLSIPPSGSSLQKFCGSGTIADLSVIGTGVKWYPVSSGGVALASGTALVNGAHYYASQTVSGCESTERLDVTAMINALPPTPPVNILVNCDSSTTLSTSVTGKLKWSTGDTISSILVSVAGIYSLTYTDLNGCSAVSQVQVSNSATGYSGILESKQDINCYGGSTGAVTLSATGGMSPYSYSMNNTDFQSSGLFQNLNAGDKVFYVRDSRGCSKPFVVRLSQPDSLVIAVQVTNVGVYGAETGKIVAAATGGTPGYWFSLDTVTYKDTGLFLNLTAGNYVVYVKDSRTCTNSRLVTLIQPVEDLTCINNTWSGTVSNAWEDPNNWNCGKVPTSNSNVTINGGTPYSPVISSNINIKSLSLNPSVILTIQPGYTLKLRYNGSQ